jgi:arylformamidase
MGDSIRSQWIDISISLRNAMVHWPGDPSVSIKRIKDMEHGDTANLSEISMGAHSGTHVDAPIHFIQQGQGVDKMPLDTMVGRARVVEIKDTESIKPKELLQHRIRRGERISVGSFKRGGSYVHRTLLSGGVWIIEGLNLSGVKQGKYDLICLPLKLGDGDGAPARAILRPLPHGRA